MGGDADQFAACWADDAEWVAPGGKVLSGLVKRIDKEMTGLALNGPAEIEAFLKTA